MKVGILGCGAISDRYFEAGKVFGVLHTSACADVMEGCAWAYRFPEQARNNLTAGALNVQSHFRTRTVLWRTVK